MSKEDYCDCNECRLHRTRVIPVLDDKPTTEAFKSVGGAYKYRVRQGSRWDESMESFCSAKEAQAAGEALIESWEDAPDDQPTVEERLEKIWAECFPPTTQELIIQALRDIAAVVDGLQSRLGALGDEMEKLKEDCQYVEVEGLKTLPARESEWLLEDDDDDVSIETLRELIAPELARAAKAMDCFFEQSWGAE